MADLKLLKSKQLYRLAFSRNPLFDIRKFEVYISLILALLLTVIITIQVKSTEQVDFIASNAKSIILNTIFGLLGVLGFLISGLAIISGTIGHKITKRIIQEKKFDSLLGILFSFNFLGYVIGFLIAFLVCSFFILSINLPLIPSIFILCTFIGAYGLFFVVFYSISLLRTCIDMFNISYIYSDEYAGLLDSRSEVEKEITFNSIRIDAITSILFKAGIIPDKNSFINELKKRAEDNILDEKLLREMFERIDRYYSV